MFIINIILILIVVKTTLQQGLNTRNNIETFNLEIDIVIITITIISIIILILLILVIYLVYKIKLRKYQIKNEIEMRTYVNEILDEYKNNEIEMKSNNTLDERKTCSIPINININLEDPRINIDNNSEDYNNALIPNTNCLRTINIDDILDEYTYDSYP